MSCAEYDRQLVDLVYGELTADERRSIEDHLADCERCRKTVSLLRATVESIGAPCERARVDVGLVYRDTARRLETSRGRWRLVGLVGNTLLAIAAGLFLVSTDFALGVGRVTVSWRESPTSRAEADAREDLSHRITELEEIIRLVALEIEASNREERESLLRLERALVELERRNETRVGTLGRDVYAMYLTQTTTNDR